MYVVEETALETHHPREGVRMVVMTENNRLVDLPDRKGYS